MTHALSASPRRVARRRLGRIVLGVCGAVGGSIVLGLIAALVWVVGKGLADLGGTLGRHDELSEALTDALSGSLMVSGIATIGSVVIGVGAAVYVCEMVAKPVLVQRFFAAVQGVAALPSIVFGIVSMELALGGASHLVGVVSTSLTLSLLAIPRVILTTQQALQQVPEAMRTTAYALGATRLQTVRDHILPIAVRGIASGILVTMARTFGATAPLVMLGFALRDADAVPTLPVMALRALFQGTRIDSELAGGAIAVIVLVHVGFTLWGSQLQQRYARTRWL